jgi:nickel/cobalt transporter (NicO) family protein
MFSAALLGASSGALHAVTGPDHVLSLGPLVLQLRKAPWRIGASWGAGHALGTLLLALPALWFAEALRVPALASIGDRLAALALLVTALWSYWQSRRAVTDSPAPAGRAALGVGFLHGVTGAASLLLVLPLAATGSRTVAAVFLLAFAVGSTLGMAVLTALLARAGAKLEPRTAQRWRQVLCAATGALALLWLVTPPSS